MISRAKVCLLLILKLQVLSQWIVKCNSVTTETRLLQRPGKNLCENYYQDVPCTNQVKFVESEGSCLMKYLNQTSKECTDAEFEGEIDMSEKYGAVNLTPFAWIEKGFIYPSLNITFTNIHWKSVRMRFVKVGLSKSQICREFVLSGNIDPSSIISFDCLWGSGKTEGEHYRFQYILTTKEDRKLLFTYLIQIPIDSDVDRNTPPENYRLFILMDQTEFPRIGVKLQVPPQRLNITDAYVTLYYKENLNSSVIELKTWRVNLTNVVEGEFTRVGPFDTQDSPGYYYFNASIPDVYCNNSCVDSSTPQLQITGLRNVQVMVAIMLIIMSVIGLMAFLIWKNKYNKIPRDPEKIPNVLFIYESSYPSHIENIYKFKDFLKGSCNVSPKLDLIDIPRTDSMNPWNWYYRAFEEADYVIVFASPDETTERGLHEDNVYINLHNYAYKLLITYLQHKPKFLAACVKLPGCSWNTLPAEAIIIDKKFSLPEKLKDMFKFLNVPSIVNGSSRLINVLQQPRSAPRFSVSRPIAPIILPFNAGNFEWDEEILEPLTVRGVHLKMSGESTSEEEDDDSDGASSIVGLKC